MIFAPGFVLELFAFLILLNRRWAFGMGAALIAMHFGIGWIMRLHFPEFEVLVLLYCVNLPFLCAAAASRFSGSLPGASRINVISHRAP